ncbi:MAG: hypothetical protein QW514_03435 [Thermoprotei archaeon]
MDHRGGRGLQRPLYTLFAAIFLVQIGLQQFFVRLSPYLFSLNFTAATENTLIALGSISVDLSAVIGVAALIAVGVESIGVGGVKRVVGVPLLILGVFVFIMDAVILVLPSTEFSTLYGSTLWYQFTTVVLSTYTLTALVAFVLVLTTRGVGPLIRVGTLLLTLAATTMGTYYIYAHIYTQTPIYLISISFNLAINALGFGVAALALGYLLNLKSIGRWLSLGLALVGGGGVAYLFYGGLFSDKIFELIWQTSFGAPLPLPQSVGYAFFMLLLFFSVVAGCARSKCEPMRLISAVILASSVFLVSSLLVYAQAAALACFMLLERLEAEATGPRETTTETTPQVKQHLAPSEKQEADATIPTYPERHLKLRGHHEKDMTLTVDQSTRLVKIGQPKAAWGLSDGVVTHPSANNVWKVWLGARFECPHTFRFNRAAGLLCNSGGCKFWGLRVLVEKFENAYLHMRLGWIASKRW